MTTVTETRKTPFVVEWRDGFKINIPQIDAQHKHLFALVKALDIDDVDKTVEELLDYVVTHFSDEQECMEKSGYPAFEQHLKLHEEFAAQVADFLGNGEPWTDDRMHNLRHFLNKWLIGHIMTHDLRFGNWYQKHAGDVPTAPPAPAGQRSAEPERKRGFFARLFGG